MRSRKWLLKTGALVWLLAISVSSVFAHGPRWRRVNIGFVTTPMQAVYAIDSLHIWVSTYFDDLIYSRDGGFSWKSNSLDTCCPPLAGGYTNSFFFIDTLNGWMAGIANNYPPQESFRLHTRDGGNSWSVQLDYGYNYGNQIFFVNRHKGFDVIGNACNYKDSFLVTNDSGKTWQAERTGISSCLIERLNFVDTLNGWGVFRYAPPVPGDTLGLMRTRDGGKSWSVLPVASAYCFNAWINFLDITNGWMLHCDPSRVNELRVSRTRDGGLTWDSANTFSTDYGFDSFVATDSAHLWLGGYSAYGASIQFSSDGGCSWVEQMPGVDDDIVSISAADSTHAYAVGTNGYVYIYAPQIPGDLNLDWTLSAADVVLMLNYVFLGRPTLVTPADMDFNGDCAVTLADVVLLLNRIFLGSPQLQWGCASQ